MVGEDEEDVAVMGNFIKHPCYTLLHDNSRQLWALGVEQAHLQ